MTDRYIVGECPRCQTPIIVDGRYKSKTCPKCFSRVVIKELKVFQTAHDSREARTILSKLKAVRGGLDPT